MSEQGWHDFLAAEGIEDWVVLHGGATAVFRVGSLREAVRLADALAGTPGIEGCGVMLGRDGTVTEVKVLKSTGRQRLDAIYVMNFFQWRFQPGTITSITIPRGVHVTGRANIYHDAH